MPYASESQRRYFHANEAKLKAQGVNVHEWDEASKGKDLPEKVKKKSSFKSKMAKAFPKPPNVR